jgi:hypothetical protein
VARERETHLFQILETALEGRFVLLLAGLGPLCLCLVEGLELLRLLLGVLGHRRLVPRVQAVDVGRLQLALRVGLLVRLLLQIGHLLLVGLCVCTCRRVSASRAR